MKRRNKRGFTFIEMLIVTAMLSIVSLAIYKNLDSGIRIWQEVNRQIPEEDLNIFFDKFSLDLKNSFKFSGINFLGTEENLEFATLVDSPTLGKRTIGKAIYSYEHHAGVLSREEKDFTHVYSGGSGSIRQSLSNIRSLRLIYYHYDAENKEYRWEDGWAEAGLPLAVRMELELENGADNKRFTKTVGIPVGG